MTRWTSTLFRCKVAIILRMFHVLYFMTVFWWLRWRVTLLLMSTSWGFECCLFWFPVLKNSSFFFFKEERGECDKLDRICQVGFAGAWHWPASGHSDACCDVFLCVCMCVWACEWWSGPCMCDGSLLNSCYLCQLWYQKPSDISNVTHQWYLQCLSQLCAVTWSESRLGDVSF